MPFSRGGSVHYLFSGSDVQMDPHTRLVSVEGDSSQGDGSLLLPANARPGARFFIHGGSIDVKDGTTTVGSSADGLWAYRTTTGWIVDIPASVESDAGPASDVELPTVSIEITGTQRAVDISDILTNQHEYEQPIAAHVAVTIPVGTILYSAHAAKFAITTGAASKWHADSTITLVNAGKILGTGGSGTGVANVSDTRGAGSGGPFPFVSGDYYPGVGGHCIEANIPMTVINTGSILAGAGGGVCLNTGDDGAAGAGQGFVQHTSGPYIGGSYLGDQDFLTGDSVAPGLCDVKGDHYAQGGRWGCPGQAHPQDSSDVATMRKAGMPGLLADGDVTFSIKGSLQGLTRNESTDTWCFYYRAGGWKQDEAEPDLGLSVAEATGSPIDIEDLLAFYGHTTEVVTVTVDVGNNAKLGSFPLLPIADKTTRTSTGFPLDGLRQDPIIITGSLPAGSTITIDIEAGSYLYGHGAVSSQGTIVPPVGVGQDVHPNGGDAIVVQHPTTINNAGTIYGGGGAGQSNGAYVAGDTEYAVGGGGAGYPHRVPSRETADRTNPNYYLFDETAQNPLKTTFFAGLGGGVGETGEGMVPSGQGTFEPGVDDFGEYGQASLAGYAVKEDGAVATINNTGTIKGR